MDLKCCFWCVGLFLVVILLCVMGSIQGRDRLGDWGDGHRGNLTYHEGWLILVLPNILLTYQKVKKTLGIFLNYWRSSCLDRSLPSAAGLSVCLSVCASSLPPPCPLPQQPQSWNHSPPLFFSFPVWVWMRKACIFSPELPLRPSARHCVHPGRLWCLSSLPS